MTRIDRILKELSELYDFNRKLKSYKIKEKVCKPLKVDAAKDLVGVTSHEEPDRGNG